jgi:hypothetical protein
MYVAWTGFSTSEPSILPNSTVSFRTQIFISRSTDGGETFSAPVQVSNDSDPATYNCFDPSVALPPGDSVVYVTYVCYGSATPSAHVIELAQARTSTNSGTLSFLQEGVISGLGLDRPWMTIAGNGTLYLVWDNVLSMSWAKSNDGGFSFSEPHATYFAFAGFVTGIEMSQDGTLYASAFGYGTYSGKGPHNYDVLLAEVTRGSSSDSLVMHNLTRITSPYSDGVIDQQKLTPGPALAVSSAGVVYLVFSTDLAHSLSMIRWSPGNESASSPATLVHENNSLIQMPWAALDPGGTELAIGWMGNATGSWDAYADVLFLSGPKLLNSVMVSSVSGFPSSTLNWHGDFIGVAFTAEGSFAVTWGDGRGLPGYWGYGHIYVAMVTIRK